MSEGNSLQVDSLLGFCLQGSSAEQQQSDKANFESVNPAAEPSQQPNPSTFASCQSATPPTEDNSLGDQEKAFWDDLLKAKAEATSTEAIQPPLPKTREMQGNNKSECTIQNRLRPTQDSTGKAF